MLSHFEGEAFAHHDDAGFGCVVGPGAGQGGVGVDAGNVDDAAAAGGLCEHLPAGLLGQEEDGAQVDADDVLPVLGGRLQEWFGEVDAGVVHEAVDAAEGVDCFLHQFGLGLVVADIAVHGQGIAGQAGGHVAGGIAADIGHDDVGAFAAADGGDTGAQAATGAGYDDGFACQ